MAGTAAASVPAQHPPSGGPHGLLNTHWRSRSATSHTALAALENRTRYYRHTCPAQTLGKHRQALGRLFDGDTMIPWRRIAKWAFSRAWQASASALPKEAGGEVRPAAQSTV